MEKKMLVLVLMVVLAAFTLIACAGTEVRQTSDVPGVSGVVAVAPRPVWNIGDNWTYKRETGTSFTWTVKQVGDGYVIEERGLNIFFRYYTLDLSYIKSVNAGGKIIYKNDPAMKYYSWPLQPGKKWHQVIYWKDLKTSNTIEHWAMVYGLETIEVPAGKFECFKIVRTAGDWTYTYWYSPIIKNYVRWVTINTAGTFTMELTDSKVTGQQQLTGMK